MLKSGIIGAALLALSACTWFGNHGDTSDPGDPATTYQRITFAAETATAEERAQCEAVGGEVRPAGLLGAENCIQTYADAGKACSDTSDCQGLCMVTGEFVDMDSATNTGQCQVTDSPFGCYQTVENGRATPALCVD